MVSTRGSVLARGGALTALILAVVAAWHFLPLEQWLTQLQDLVRSTGPWAPVVYAVTYAVLAVLFVPATFLSLGAGALFGPLVGTIVVLCGASAAAAASFAIARLLLRARVSAALSRDARFLSLDRAIASEGGRIVLLVRLSPVFPFTWVNYAFGVTGVTARAYLAGTVAGMLPGVIAIVYLGYAAGSLTQEVTPVQTALRAVGALATVAAAFVIGRIARRAMRDAGIDAASSAEELPDGDGSADKQRTDATDTSADE